MNEKERLRKMGILEVNKVLDSLTAEEVEKIVNDKYECKVCHEMITPRELLEHCAVKHNDPDAFKLLDDMNRLSRRGT
jgi:hypothetical protein